MCAALASLAFAASPARAQGLACDLEVKAEPAAVLGADAATVRVVVAAGEEPVRLRASPGRIAGVRSAGMAWLADWEIPKRGPPEVAIVSAFDGDRCGFVAVPLAGWVNLKVKSRPGEEVELEVGHERFGPVRAGAAGLAELPVLVPPGARRAWRGETPVEIPARAQAALELILVEREAGPGSGELLATVFVVAADGGPWAGAPPTLEATAGEVAPLAPAGPGAWRAVWRVSRGEAGATLQARAGGQVRRARLADVPGPVARVEVRADRPVALAGDPAGIAVEVRTLDAAGLPADGRRPSLESDLGQAEEMVMAEPGTWRTTLPVPVELRGLRRARIEARVGPVAGTAGVELAGGPPAALEGWIVLRPPAGSGPVPGSLTVGVADAHGNPTAAEGLVAQAARGSLGPPEAGEDGRLVFPYRLERAGEEAVEDTVQLQLGGLSAAVPVRWVPPPPRLVLSPRAGVAARSGGPGLQAGLQAASFWHVGDWQLGMAVDLAASDFRSSGRLDVPAVGWSGTTALGAASISAALRTRPARRLVLVASAGGGAAYLSHRTALEAQRALTEAGWAALGTAALALGIPAWRGGPFLEARATWVPDPGLESLRGGLFTFSLSLGYWLDAL
jgi:hypothetical protein